MFGQHPANSGLAGGGWAINGNGLGQSHNKLHNKSEPIGSLYCYFRLRREDEGGFGLGVLTDCFSRFTS
jgi:hypothetical protein